MTIECPKCQFRNPDETSFCGKCGAKFYAEIDHTKTLKSQGADKLIADKYQILEELGRGGMGVVYKAKDVKLDRTVALKFLPPGVSHNKEAKKRFIQEAKAASGLDHTNICTIYEIGDPEDEQMFIAMPYYEGESLKEKIGKEPLEIDDAVSIGTQIAEGLSRAHKKDIVHRDIKPANIMITEEGVVKIVDFGIAKLGGAARLTQTGSTVGTTAYMSPEQTQGEKVDSRSDIWSLGVVLYEMLTSQLPFKGEQMQSMVYSILNKDPEAITSIQPDIPRHIEHVVMKALEKDPTKRYQNAGELKQDLKTAPSLSFPKTDCSIVVLPFEDMSPKRDNEYFSDGLTEEIIADLSQIHSLCVISRNSAMALKGSKKNTKTIGRELNVQYVLEGSVRKAGNNLRITAQLIDAKTDVHLWAEKYKGTLDDVFDIQEKVSRSIVDEIKLQLTPEEEAGIGERGIENIQVYEYYLRARREVYKLTKEGLDNALGYLEKGLDIVGDNVLLYACMGNVYYQYWNYGVWPDMTNIQKAEECAQRIFELESDSKHGHFLLGLLQIFIDPHLTLQHFKQVLSEDPYHPETLLWLSLFVVFQGKQRQAEILLERLMQVDPLNPIVKILPGNLHIHCGRLELGLETLEKVYESDPDHFVARFHYAKALAYVNRLGDACAVTDQLAKMTLGKIRTQLFRLYYYAFQGKKSDVLQAVSQEFLTWVQRDWMGSLWLSEIFALIEEKGKALDWLCQAVDLGIINYPFLNEYNPLLKNIRGEERFQRLMEEIKPKWENFAV